MNTLFQVKVRAGLFNVHKSNESTSSTSDMFSVFFFSALLNTEMLHQRSGLCCYANHEMRVLCGTLGPHFIPCPLTFSPSPLLFVFIFMYKVSWFLLFQLNSSWHKDFLVARFKWRTMQLFPECLPNLWLCWPNANIFSTKKKLFKLQPLCCLSLKLFQWIWFFSSQTHM